MASPNQIQSRALMPSGKHRDVHERGPRREYETDERPDESVEGERPACRVDETPYEDGEAWTEEDENGEDTTHAHDV